MIQRCALLPTLNILSCYILLGRSSKHSFICQWFLRKRSHPHRCPWWQIPPSHYVHRRNRPDLSVPNCHSYSHKKAILATECDTYSGYSLCSCHVSLSNACTRWHDSKRFYRYTSFRERSYYSHEYDQPCYVVHYISPKPQLWVDVILVLVLHNLLRE